MGGAGKAGQPVQCPALWPAQCESTTPLYRGVTPPARLVVSQQQHDDQPLPPPAQPLHRVDGGRGQGSRNAPRLCRPLIPRPEAQGAQTQVNLNQMLEYHQRL